MIEVRHLTKRYGEHTAVSDLSFTVEDGVIYGFLGPNGAGKTTTMNIMTGYLAPTDGEVIINGFDILEEPEAAKKTIGYLPEVPPVYPDLTVSEYLTFASSLKGIPARERPQAVDQAVRELGLEEVRGRLIRNLSKGFRQRVGFAQAILGSPRTLILDEPTVGLDPRQIIEIRELIRKLGKKHTVILSSHILSEVSEICDRVLIISHGKLAACDTPENLMLNRRGECCLEILAEGDAVKAGEALKALADLSVQAKIRPEDPEEGHFRIEIRHAANEDIRSAVSRTLFGQGCAVVEMKESGASLESIFLDLTEDEEDEPGPGSARAEEPDEVAEEPAEGFFAKLFRRKRGEGSR